MDRRVIAAYRSRLVTLRENQDRPLHAHPVPAQEVNVIQVPALGQARVQESAEVQCLLKPPSMTFLHL
ncbi:unnamed protein product [Taenia asiatica]|uniref:Uncharacterized protein n=1 Tax=Taenia asiatica TaxID=60517 RepID=A0A0R3W1Y4_TAEAS|nr:unnamed protein product [Taenia asiatica]